MRRTLALSAAILALAVSLLLPLHHQAPPVQAQVACDVPENRQWVDGVEWQAVLEINAQRIGQGLAPLVVSARLQRSAAWKALVLAGSAPFGHDDPSRTWDQRVIDCGYPASANFTENLSGGAITAAELVHDWNSSPDHRANMFAPEAKYIGMARAIGGPMGTYWVAVFGDIE